MFWLLKESFHSLLKRRTVFSKYVEPKTLVKDYKGPFASDVVTDLTPKLHSKEFQPGKHVFCGSRESNGKELIVFMRRYSEVPPAIGNCCCRPSYPETGMWRHQFLDIVYDSDASM